MKMRAVSKHHFIALILAAAAVAAASASAQTSSHIGRYASSPVDTAAILQVTQDFQAAIIAKDGSKLADLLLHPKILFSTPASPSWVKKRWEEGNRQSDGVGTNGAADFIAFVANAAEPVEEKFYNIKITQDGHLAWVMFDYEFLQNNKVQNYGIETWQMLKTPGDRWKILSVVWSSHGAPK
jgi:SnoaL-like domain